MERAVYVDRVISEANYSLNSRTWFEPCCYQCVL